MDILAASRILHWPWDTATGLYAVLAPGRGDGQPEFEDDNGDNPVPPSRGVWGQPHPPVPGVWGQARPPIPMRPGGCSTGIARWKSYFWGPQHAHLQSQGVQAQESPVWLCQTDLPKISLNVKIRLYLKDLKAIFPKLK